jgi:O-antigen/teichoic acid export membrane protein
VTTSEPVSANTSARSAAALDVSSVGSDALTASTATDSRRRVSPSLLLRVGRLPTTLSNGALLLGGLVSSVMSSRALGPGGRGEYVTWQTWITTIGILALGGLPQAMVLDRRTANRHRFGDLALPLLSTCAAAGAILGVLLLVKRPDWRIDLAVLLGVLETQLAGVAIAEAQRMGRMATEFNIVRLLEPASAVAAMVALLAARTTDPAAWVLAVCGTQAGVLIAWMALANKRGQGSPGTDRRLVRETLHLAPGNWVTLVQYRLELVAITAIFPPQIVAFYAIALAAQAAVTAVGDASGMHWFARRGAEFDNRRPQLRGEVLKTAGLTLASAVVIAAVSELTLNFIYGRDYLPALPIVAVLCGVGVIRSVDYLLNKECLMLGAGRRVGLYRLPALVALVLGFATMKIAALPVIVAGFLSGLGYTLSAAALAVAARSAYRVSSQASPLT